MLNGEVNLPIYGQSLYRGFFESAKLRDNRRTLVPRCQPDRTPRAAVDKWTPGVTLHRAPVAKETNLINSAARIEPRLRARGQMPLSELMHEDSPRFEFKRFRYALCERT